MFIQDFRIKFEPRDLWIGLYWDLRDVYSEEYMVLYLDHGIEDLDPVRVLEVYICIVPLFPICIEIVLEV